VLGLLNLSRTASAPIVAEQGSSFRGSFLVLKKSNPVLATRIVKRGAVSGASTALSKSKKHYVSLTWQHGEKKGGLAMQFDKNEYRGILTGLEGVTGKKDVE
jgi:hypothetical protein